MVNRPLPRVGAMPKLLTETGARVQDANMTARMTLSAAILLAACTTASAACGGAIAEFEAIITSDVATGNLNKAVHRRIVSELASVRHTCAAGRDADAARGLAAVKSRHGYR
jgi:hypothetical protein